MRLNLVKRKRTAQKTAATAVGEGRGTARKQHKIWKSKRHSVKEKYCTVNEREGKTVGYVLKTMWMMWKREDFWGNDFRGRLG